jgi:hypothetical protein
MNDLADRGVDGIAGRETGWTSDHLADELAHRDACGLAVGLSIAEGL